ncbi:ubiquitin-conjugating enzyme/RWD-like protein [Catenaria anguillulae PL171]|uniref:Ubiquitin-conjugating enzyme E2 Z n=1 Tax=Catenaria anguillulae PL171 TaxID=765915 RepID=A0A1Y2HWE0_9FUNG|nr:ubiquitin-conjugating enzyme/RWD-like protein [Catenaria anguillulae PL171]
MADKHLFRIHKELRDIQRNPDPFFHLHYDEEDVRSLKALIVGSPETPYAYGLFTFDFKFPESYPNESPKVVITTTNNQKTRFNPNLYATGKVCLSLLGTWRGTAVENWNSAHGISSVLVSIQSLMSANPYENEPGFEEQKPEEKDNVEAYKRKITHETIRISALDRIDAYFNNRNRSDLPFEDVSKYLFMCYYRQYLATIEREQKLVKDGDKFVEMPFEGHGNTMMGTFQYSALTDRLHAAFKRLVDETQEWIEASQSPAWSEMESLSYSKMMAEYKQLVESKEFDGLLDLSLAFDKNPFVWNVSLVGPTGTNYEGGVFAVRVVFHKDFPTIRPRVTFTTPFHHPCVSEDGIPYYQPERMDDISSHLSALLKLMTDLPKPDPITHTNPKAAHHALETRKPSASMDKP